MTRGKQKIDAQRRNAERNQKSKGSQLEARAVGLKVVCPICKVISRGPSPIASHRLDLPGFAWAADPANLSSFAVSLLAHAPIRAKE
jgi:hypothetical protein